MMVVTVIVVVVRMMVIAGTHTSESEQDSQCGVQIQKLFGSCFKGLLCVTAKRNKSGNGGEQAWYFQGSLTLQHLSVPHSFSYIMVKYAFLGVHWKDWCWSWNSSTLATWWEELTHWKRLWCWEGLEAGREGEDRGWDGWMASPTQWTWVWVNSGSWWWTGRSGVLRFMGWQRVGYEWVTELNWS